MEEGKVYLRQEYWDSHNFNLLEKHNLHWSWKSISKLAGRELAQILKLQICFKIQVIQEKETHICSLLSKLISHRTSPLTGKASHSIKRGSQCNFIWMAHFLVRQGLPDSLSSELYQNSLPIFLLSSLWTLENIPLRKFNSRCCQVKYYFKNF